MPSATMATTRRCRETPTWKASWLTVRTRPDSLQPVNPTASAATVAVELLSGMAHSISSCGASLRAAPPSAMLPPMDATSRTASQRVQTALDRSNETNEQLNAFLSTRAEAATAEAAVIDGRASRGEHLPLAGVPFGVKDNIMVAGSPATAGSRMLENYVPDWTATVVERLQAAGAVATGKTNLDEFAMGSDNSTSYFGPVSNPHDPARVPGGSSGGSAAAVAAGIVPLALGTDTGGSVRQPASFCGILGFKPGYGRISRHGVIALASSLDHVGFFARDPDVLRAAWQAAAGPDERDASSVAAARQEPAELPDSVEDLRIGVIGSLAGDSNSPGVRAALAETVELLRAAGLDTGTVELPSLRYTAPAYFVLNCVEAAKIGRASCRER